jgi:ribosomal-protein-alanine N-acetyltransferase
MRNLERISNYRRISEELATSGQPTEDELAEIARAGFRCVVNLALPTSDNALPDEAASVAKLGLDYAALPIDFDRPEIDQALRLFALLEERRGQRVFVHCAANYRVSSLVYAYRVAVRRENAERARNDLLAIWSPNETWKRYMAKVQRLALPTELRLETPRTILREYNLDDADDCERYTRDPEVCRYMIWGPNGPGETQAFLEQAVRDRRANERKVFEFALVHRRDNRVAGGVGTRITNVEQREGDLGYVLRRNLWGQGIATEAARAVLDFAFDALGLHRVWATADPENVASVRVLEKLGMRREGLLRRNIFVRGAFRDSAVYAILDDERA